MMKPLAGRLLWGLLHVSAGVVLGIGLQSGGEEVPEQTFEIGREIVEQCPEHGQHVTTIVDTRLRREYQITNGVQNVWVTQEQVEFVVTTLELQQE
jgi:hypothetical protein